MGRSGSSGGRSSGGRSSGGGFSGGSRSSGGFSGGSRSGGGRSSSSGGFFGGGSSGGRSGGAPTPPPSRAPRGGGIPFPVIINTSGGGNSGGSPSGSPSPHPQPPKKSNKGPSWGLRIAFAVVALFAAYAILSQIVLCSMGSTADDTSISQSTVEREALTPAAVNETSYYTDKDGDWIHNPGKLESGMRAFYKETGVQPYLYILPNGETQSTQELSTIAEGLYDELFTDEGHFLLVFCDDGFGSFNCGYVVGSEAKTIMDGEALTILADFLDRYYSDYSLSEEEIFSKAFESTGKRIMTVSQSPLVPTLIILGIIIVALLVAYTLKKRREQKERDQQRMEDILKMPIEKFGDQKIEELAKKYEGTETAQPTTSTPVPPPSANQPTPVAGDQNKVVTPQPEKQAGSKEGNQLGE